MQQPTRGIWKIITASSVGTLIEWYDFYIFGSLSTIIAMKFFPSENPTTALLSVLATFAAGFIVRPFGALVFGRLGDIIGRKYTFLLTLVLMGLSTFLIGLVPSYATIGYWAPALVLILRLLQGLALGGEYGGAATYVAEHSPPHRRGFFTSWIQTTATLGLFVSLGVILLTRRLVGVEEFTNGDGWRYPFLLSIVLVVVSIVIRMKMHESPLFAKLKAQGKTATNPLKESFGNKTNFKMVLLALFGATMGQGVIWYTGQFYAQNFLLARCQVDYEQGNTIILIALALATPFFIFFGWLSDRVGRKWIMLTGMLCGVVFYRPIFATFLKDTDIKTWQQSDYKAINEAVTVNMYNGDSVLRIATVYQTPEGNSFTRIIRDTLRQDRNDAEQIINANANASYESKVLGSGTYWKFIFLVFIMVLFVTMVYGPIAAFLVELFPTRIRYTSMSLPYHIGNGVFGGLVPFIGVLLSTLPGSDQLTGLWYPIGIAALCFIIGALYLSNNTDKNVND